MSVNAIRIALETGLNSITPALATAWENAKFTPTEGTPYQRVSLLFAEPDNIEYGSVFRQNGIMQVSLFYPLLTGTSTASTRAELLRSTFKRGNTYTSGSVKVNISNTPAIKQGRVDGDRWMIPVDIRFFSHITA